VSFLSGKLPLSLPYRYEVFDVITDLLISQGGRARKGDGRGDPDRRISGGPALRRTWRNGL